jgi:hypothetical protein
LLACTVLVACSGNPPTAAGTLASTFASDVVGKLVPEPVRPGDYAMTLAMKFQTYLSMEMTISEQRTGAASLTLAVDGTAHACIGLRVHHRREGQLHYVKPTDRELPDDGVRKSLIGLAGTWTLVDGVAEIRFDRVGTATCSASAAAKSVVALRCIAVGRTDRIPVSGLACEASADSGLELVMPMTTESRSDPERHFHETPTGRNLVFGAPLVAVDVEQDDSDRSPVISFQTGTVPLVESEYR